MVVTNLPKNSDFLQKNHGKNIDFFKVMKYTKFDWFNFNVVLPITGKHQPETAILLTLKFKYQLIFSKTEV